MPRAIRLERLESARELGQEIHSGERRASGWWAQGFGFPWRSCVVPMAIRENFMWLGVHIGQGSRQSGGGRAATGFALSRFRGSRGVGVYGTGRWAIGISLNAVTNGVVRGHLGFGFGFESI